MKILKNLSKRGLALFLVLTMCMSLLPVTAMAAEFAEGRDSAEPRFTQVMPEEILEAVGKVYGMSADDLVAYGFLDEPMFLNQFFGLVPGSVRLQLRDEFGAEVLADIAREDEAAPDFYKEVLVTPYGLFAAPEDEAPAPAEEAENETPAPAEEAENETPAPAEEAEDETPVPTEEAENETPAPAEEVENETPALAGEAAEPLTIIEDNEVALSGPLTPVTLWALIDEEVPAVEPAEIETLAANGTVRVYVYVSGKDTSGEKDISDEALKLLNIDPATKDTNGYFPAGEIEVDASFFEGKPEAIRANHGKACITSDSDWDDLQGALGQMNTSTLVDQSGKPYSNNRGNRVSEYIGQAFRHLNATAGNKQSALFPWTRGDYSYGFEDQSVKYHLDLVFNTATITFTFEGKNEPFDTRTYITGSKVQEPRNLNIPDDYQLVGYYSDSACTTRWNGIGRPLNENTNVYVKIAPLDDVIIQYAVSPDGAGTVSRDTEGVNPVSGNPNGSIATANHGYRFVNWTDEDGNEVGTDATFVPTDNQKVAGKWVSATYTANFDQIAAVTYHGNGGTVKSGESSMDTVVRNDVPVGSYTVESNESIGFTNPGHTFVKWTYDAAGTQDVTASVNLTADGLHFYAKWAETVPGTPEVTKKADKEVVTAGDKITYTVTIDPDDNGAAVNRFTIVDTLVPDFTADGVNVSVMKGTNPIQGNWDDDGRTFTMTGNDADGYRTPIRVTYTYEVKETDVITAEDGSEVVRNIVTVTVYNGETPNPDPEDPEDPKNEAQVDVPYETPKLSVQKVISKIEGATEYDGKSTAPATVKPDSTITWTIIVSNSKPVEAKGVKLTDYFNVEGNASETLTSGPSAEGVTDINSFTVPAAQFDNNGNKIKDSTVVFTATYEVPSNATPGAKITNSAVATQDPEEPKEPEEPDTKIEVEKKAVTIAKSVSGMTGKKTVDGKEVAVAKVGNKLTYTIIVTNTGNVALTENLKISDTFNGYAGIKDETPVGGVYTLTLVLNEEEPLAVNASKSITYTYTVQPEDAGKTLTNVAVVAEGEPVTDETPDPEKPEDPRPNETKTDVEKLTYSISKELVIPADAEGKAKLVGVSVVDGKLVVNKKADGTPVDSITLLYKITVTGDAGAKYTISDLGADPEELTGKLEGTAGQPGVQKDIFVTMTFTAVKAEDGTITYQNAEQKAGLSNTATAEGSDTTDEPDEPEVTAKSYTVTVKYVDDQNKALQGDTILILPEDNSGYSVSIPNKFDNVGDPAQTYALDTIKVGDGEAQQHVAATAAVTQASTEKITADVMIVAVYSLDVVDEENPEEPGPDGIPDKYEVTYQFTNGDNGRLDDSTPKYLVQVLKDAAGNYTTTGTASITAEDKVIAVPNTGYAVDKWTSEDFASFVKESASLIVANSDNLTVYGNRTYTFNVEFKAVDFTVVLDPNGGNWDNVKPVDEKNDGWYGFTQVEGTATTSKTTEISTRIRNEYPVPERAGYTFKGWTIQEAGKTVSTDLGLNIIYSVQQLWNGIGAPADRTVTLVAKWEVQKLTYKVVQHFRVTRDPDEVNPANISVDGTAEYGTPVSELIQGKTVNQMYKEQQYIYVAEETTPGVDSTLTKNGTVIDLYYYLDTWNDVEDNDEKPDGTPDVDQVRILYTVDPEGSGELDTVMQIETLNAGKVTATNNVQENGGYHFLYWSGDKEVITATESFNTSTLNKPFTAVGGRTYEVVAHLERNLAASAEDVEVYYDGVSHGIDVTVTGAEDYTITYYADAAHTKEINNSFVNVADSSDVYYVVTADRRTVEGSAKVTIQPVMLRAAASEQTKVYDGKPFSSSDLEENWYTLTVMDADVIGDSAVKAAEAFIETVPVSLYLVPDAVEVGTYLNGIAPTIAADALNGNYTIDGVPAKLVITPKLLYVTVTGSTAAKTYNGEEQSVTGYKIVIKDGAGEDAAVVELPNVFAEVTAEAKGTDVDTYNMGLQATKFKLTEEYSKNYKLASLTVNDGWLKIEPKPLYVTVTGNTATETYNGEEQSVTGYTVVIKDGAGEDAKVVELPDALAATASGKATGTDVGTHKMGLKGTDFTLADAYSKNYKLASLTVNDGWLKIEPKPLYVTVTGNTATKTYNGEEQSVTGYTVVIKDGAGEDAAVVELPNVFAEVTAEATGTDVGTHKMGLKGTDFTLADAYSKNYKLASLTVNDGWLKIEPLAVTITVVGNTNTLVYNGNQQSVTGIRSMTADVELKDAEVGLKAGQQAVAQGTNVGTYYMGLAKSDFELTGKGAGNYTIADVHVTDGWLQITNVPYNPPAVPTFPTPTPTPGYPGTPSGTNINDNEVPLAAPGLNSDDHFDYLKGYPDGTVRPSANITRGEVATIFFRLMTNEFRTANWATENDFSDVKSSDWYNNAISTCVKAGILKGYTDGTFRPNQAITRAEFAAIAASFASEAVPSGGMFKDIEGHWAQESIERAAAAGWIKGSNGMFRPNDRITRAEVVTTINRMLDRVPDADHMLPDMKTFPDNTPDMWWYADIQEATNSHDYERAEDGVTGIWTELLPEQDWTALEKEWATAADANVVDVASGLMGESEKTEDETTGDGDDN